MRQKMNDHDKEKYELEKEAIDLFIEIYNNYYDNPLKIIQKQESPDFLLSDNLENKIGVEVAHIFYDSLEAKILLNRSDGKIHEVETFDVFMLKLNELLAKKFQKIANFKFQYPCSLLIRDISPIFTSEDIESSLNKINIADNLYKDIWILSHNGRDSWVIIKIK